MPKRQFWVFLPRFYVCLFPSVYGEILASAIASQLYKILRKFDKCVVKIKMKAEFEDTHSLSKRATILLAHIHFNAVTNIFQVSCWDQNESPVWRKVWLDPLCNNVIMTSHGLEFEHAGRHCGWIVSRLIFHYLVFDFCLVTLGGDTF